MFGENVRIGYGVVIEQGCEIGDNTLIAHHTVLRPNTKIGSDCTIGHLVVFEGETHVGGDVYIGSQSHITLGAFICDKVFIGPSVLTANTRNIVHGREIPLIVKGPTILRAARIGGGSHLFPGITIGTNALIGLGSVVTKNVPPMEIWFGNPATYRSMVKESELL